MLLDYLGDRLFHIRFARDRSRQMRVARIDRIDLSRRRDSARATHGLSLEYCSNASWHGERFVTVARGRG